MPAVSPAGPAQHPRWVLVVASLASFMVALDAQGAGAAWIMPLAMA